MMTRKTTIGTLLSLSTFLAISWLASFTVGNLKLSPGHPPPLSSKLAKVSMLYGEDPTSVYSRALDRQRDYASHFGYAIHILDREIVQSCHEYSKNCTAFNAHNLGGTWAKMIYLQYRLVSELSKDQSERVEWLVWQDADTVSLSLAVDMAIFLPPASLPVELSSRIHLLVSDDLNGLNTGVFFLRVSEWSLKFILACLSQSFTGNEIDLGWNYDQDAMSHVLSNDSHFNTTGQAVRQPKTWYNSYAIPELNDVAKGHLIVHFPGMREPSRTMAISTWLDKVSTEPGWTSSAEDNNNNNNSVAKEVEQFWTDYAQQRASESIR